MKSNVGTIDRLVRLVAALTITLLFLFKLISGVAGIILLAVAGIFLVTAIIGTCPLYRIFGISSRFNNKKQA